MSAHSLEDEGVVHHIRFDVSRAQVCLAGAAGSKDGGVSSLDAFFDTLAENDVELDALTQSVIGATMHLSFGVHASDVGLVKQVLRSMRGELASWTMSYERVARVVLEGRGFRSHPHTMTTTLRTLAAERIAIRTLTHSSGRILCVIDVEDVERATVSLGKAFGLRTAASPASSASSNDGGQMDIPRHGPFRGTRVARLF